MYILCMCYMYIKYKYVNIYKYICINLLRVSCIYVFI